MAASGLRVVACHLTLAEIDARRSGITRAGLRVSSQIQEVLDSGGITGTDRGERKRYEESPKGRGQAGERGARIKEMLTAAAYDIHVDQLFERLRRFHAAMDAAGLSYRIVGE